MFHNINTLTKISSLNLCVDKTSYPFASLSEIGSGITGCVHNKLCLSKDGHTNVVTDYHTCRPIFCIHLHNHHPVGEDFSRQGGNDLCIFVGLIKPIIILKEVVAGSKKV